MKTGFPIMLLACLACLLLAAAGCADKKTVPALEAKERELARKKLSGMKDQVELISFGRKDSAASVRAAALFDELAGIQPKLLHRRLDAGGEAALAASLKIGVVPTVVLKKGAITGLRFLGRPDGFEYQTFLETIDRLSRDAPALSAATVAALTGLRTPVTVKVFVTAA